MPWERPIVQVPAATTRVKGEPPQPFLKICRVGVEGASQECVPQWGYLGTSCISYEGEDEHGDTMWRAGRPGGEGRGVLFRGFLGHKSKPMPRKPG